MRKISQENNFYLQLPEVTTFERHKLLNFPVSLARCHTQYLEKEHLAHLLSRKQSSRMKLGEMLNATYSVFLLYGATISLQVFLNVIFGRSCIRADRASSEKEVCGAASVCVMASLVEA